jgi:hypothetical protein
MSSWPKALASIDVAAAVTFGDLSVLRFTPARLILPWNPSNLSIQEYTRFHACIIMVTLIVDQIILKLTDG